MFFLIIFKIINRFAWRSVELLALFFSHLCWSAEYDITFPCFCFKFHFLDFHGWDPVLQLISNVWEQDHFVWTLDRTNMVFIYMEFLGWYLTECHQMFVGIFESDAWVWWVVGFFGFFFSLFVWNFFLLMKQTDYFLYSFKLSAVSYQLYEMYFLQLVHQRISLSCFLT